MLTSLVRDLEVIQERVTSRDGALVHEGGAIGPVRALLEETVPMLNLPSRVPAFNNELRGENEL